MQLCPRDPQVLYLSSLCIYVLEYSTLLGIIAEGDLTQEST